MKPNHTLAFVAAAVAAVSLGACSKFGTHSQAPHVSQADPSAQLIGTQPGPTSTTEPPGVTPVAPEVKKDETKAQAQSSGPKEGDDSSHFTNSPGQKTAAAGGKGAS